MKARKIIESLGGKVLSLFYTFGRYDFVVIVDMPSRENLVKFLLDCREVWHCPDRDPGDHSS